MSYRGENICFCGGLQFQDINGQKILASRGLLALKVSTLKVKGSTWVCAELLSRGLPTDV
jgi:hypothetical protein